MTMNINQAPRNVGRQTLQQGNYCPTSCQRQCSFLSYSFDSRCFLFLLGTHFYPGPGHRTCPLLDFYQISSPLSLHLLLAIPLRAARWKNLVFLFSRLIFSLFTLSRQVHLISQLFSMDISMVLKRRLWTQEATPRFSSLVNCRLIYATVHVASPSSRPMMPQSKQR